MHSSAANGLGIGASAGSTPTVPGMVSSGQVDSETASPPMFALADPPSVSFRHTRLFPPTLSLSTFRREGQEKFASA